MAFDFPQPDYLMNTTRTSSMISSSTISTKIPLETRLPFLIVLIVLYALIFFFGITGNALVVFVVCRNKAMQTVTNVFITNLAFSDILMCFLAVPFTPISAYGLPWHLGKIMCHIVPMSLGISVYVSTLTSLAIAVDRYFVIVHPFRSRMRLGVCILLIIVIWIVGISISLPLAIYIRLDRSKCEEHWPQYTSRRFFNFSSLVLQYLIPFSVISFSYFKVWSTLARRSLPGRTRVREEVEIYRKKRTNRMLIAMVVIFAICWLPLNIVHMVAEYTRTTFVHYRLFFLTTHVIAMSSTVYNPFLYAWLNDNFRKEFQHIIPCLFQVCFCFNGNRSNCPTVTTTIADGDVYYDRSSITHQFPVEGRSNGHSTRKTTLENIQLTSIKSLPLVEEGALNSNDSTNIIETNLNHS